MTKEETPKVKRQKRNLLIFVIAIVAICFCMAMFILEIELLRMAWK